MFSIFFSPSSLRHLEKWNIDQLCENWMISAVNSNRDERGSCGGGKTGRAHAVTSVVLVASSIIKTSHCLYLTELYDNEIKIDTDIHWINKLSRVLCAKMENLEKIFRSSSTSSRWERRRHSRSISFQNVIIRVGANPEALARGFSVKLMKITIK